MLSAQAARDAYANDTYLQGLEAVQEAIQAHSPTSHQVVVNIPTGKRDAGEVCEASLVARKLGDLGYNVAVIHDPENGSTELTINWG